MTTRGTLTRLRELALVVHRWVGLFMAVFLLVAGLTGTMMAYYRPLDRLLNPELFVAEPPKPGAPLLDPFVLRDRLNDQLPEEKRVDYVMLELLSDSTVNYWVDGRETFVNPYTGAIQGSREFGSLREGRKSILTFFYELHFTLGIGDVGLWIMGVVALLWCFDCFVGAYLTFPPGLPNRGATVRWVARWSQSWLLKTKRLFSLVFTWHRASGLWVWAMLLVFAWSAVALNLNERFYAPLMDAVWPRHEQELPELAKPREKPRLDERSAHARARQALDEQARARGFRVYDERYLSYEVDHGTYGLTVHSSLDVGERLSETTVFVDGDDGHFVALMAPTGHDARSTFDSYLIALHFGSWDALGAPYRAFVAVLGVLVAALSVTGVWIWLRKRSAKARGRLRSSSVS